MRENKKKENIFAKRGFFITLVVITAVMVIAVVMNMVLPDEEEKDTFDSDAWQSAVQQSAKNREESTGNTYQEEAKAVNATAVPATEKPAAQAGQPAQTEKAKTTAAGESKEIPKGTNDPAAAQTWGKEKEEGKASEKPSSSPAPTSTAAGSDAAQTGVMRMESPVPGAIAKDFASDELVYSETMQDWRVHEGIDFAADENAEVKAAADGTVESVSEDGMLGACVIIGHSGGVKTFYGNLQEGSAPPVGTQVKTGDVIGKVGKTAALEIMDPSHLHFEVIYQEKSVNPHTYLKDTVTDDE